MFPDSRLKEVTALLGDDNESLRSLKEMVAEDRPQTPGRSHGFTVTGLQRDYPKSWGQVTMTITHL
jgi:hypothetical protein